MISFWKLSNLQMRTSKSLYTDCFQEYSLSQSLLDELHSVLLEILLDVKQVCDDNDIKYMLSGGTMLGAIRHRGFIPWDDDIDIMMLRDEYNKFKDLFINSFSDKYDLVEPLSRDNYYNKMVKIYKRGTKFVEIPFAGADSPNMVFIDLFLIENVPGPGFKRKCLSNIYNFAFKGASVALDYLYPSPVILEKSRSNTDIRRYYSFRRFLGFFFATFGGIRFYLRICDRIANQTTETGWKGIPSGISYEREIFPSEVFDDLIDVEFCGHMMKCPKNYDLYLNNLYGDYMTIPPKEKREVHVAYRIEL